MRRTINPYLLLPSAVLLSQTVLAQVDTAAFEGVWSGYITSQDDPYWQVEDYACFVGCPKVAYDYLTALLDDPANDERAVGELIGQTRGFIEGYLKQRSTPAGLALMAGNSEANDTNIACHPYDFVRSATNPLPLALSREGDALTIRYEEWNRVRTVYLDGRAFPADLAPSSLGYSVGRFEDGALVIETRGIAASTYPPITINAAGGHSDQLRGSERYTLTPGTPTVLTLELTLEDPGTLTEPYVYYKTWIATPDIELLTDSCEDTPGEF
jgi:hypothetical protein